MIEFMWFLDRRNLARVTPRVVVVVVVVVVVGGSSG
jgi:hypothetical protein